MTHTKVNGMASSDSKPPHSGSNPPEAPEPTDTEGLALGGLDTSETARNLGATKTVTPVEPSFVWSLYYPAPETKHWRVTGMDVDGQQGVYVDVLMHCDQLRHSPGLNRCKVCFECHELPKATDERYAYRWYPSKPSIKSVMQWNRRNWERRVR
jgi:hypothetical protein